jgi:thiamine biosynthesis lipoprotein
MSIALCVSACERAPTSHVISGPTMGTTYTVRWLGRESAPSDFALRSEVEAELARVDLQMSRYREDSELSRFNATRSTEPQAVSPEFAQLLSESLAINAASEGAFDIAIAPFVDAWGFGPGMKRARVPTATELEAVRARCGLQWLEVSSSPTAVRKLRSDVELDLNAIAPGNAVDRIARLLERHALENYLIDIGGEIRVRGVNAAGAAWRIAVDDPRHTQQVAFATVELSHGAIATSGGYRQFHNIDGRQYSHLIDPRTGQPALMRGSVVVIASTASQADAWATALFVLGEEAGMRVATEHDIAALFLILENQQVRERATPAFRKYRLMKAT